MFKIRDFAQLGQVSVKTLRFYDRMGLLKPAQVDQRTGYRYYASEQLLRLNRILTFKDLGFTLEQIVDLLDEQISSEQMRGMFRLKQAEIQTLIESEQARLLRIEGRLRQIEAGEIHDVVLKSVAAQKVVSIRQSMAPAGVPLLLAELHHYLHYHEVVTTAPYWVIWHGCEECENAVDLEVACPVAQSLPSSEQIHPRTLPAVPTMASLMHECQPQSICSASRELADWIEANHYRMVTSQHRREIYLTSEDNGFYIAEVQIPVISAGE
jgi:DNA-binding transcriptional MerR regulator